MMRNSKQISAWTLAIVVASGLSGCVGFGRCAPENCASDKTALAELNQTLASHRELGAPAAIHTQVINGVAYLSGIVDTDFEIRRAESITSQVPGVRDVVNSLTPRNTGR